MVRAENTRPAEGNHTGETDAIPEGGFRALMTPAQVSEYDLHWMQVADRMSNEAIDNELMRMENGLLTRPGGQRYRPGMISSTVDMRNGNLSIGYSGRTGFNPSRPSEPLTNVLQENIRRTEDRAAADETNPNRANRSFEVWPVDNCAEIYSANRPLSEGAQMSDLYFNSRRGRNSGNGSMGQYEPPCGNCRSTFEGSMNPDTLALRELTVDAARNGNVSESDAQILREWADEYNDPTVHDILNETTGRNTETQPQLSSQAPQNRVSTTAQSPQSNQSTSNRISPINNTQSGNPPQQTNSNITNHGVSVGTDLSVNTDPDVTLYSYNLGNASISSKPAASIGGAVEGEHGSASANMNFMQANANAGADISITKDGLSVGGNFEAEYALAKGEASAEAEYGGIGVHADASGMVGANVSGNAELALGMVDGQLQAGADAEIGAYLAKGEVSGGINIFGIDITGTAEGKIGAGAEAGIGFKDGKFYANIGATLGIGGNLGVEVDASEFIDNVGDFVGDAGEAIEDGAKAVGDFFGGIGDTIGGWF